MRKKKYIFLFVLYINNIKTINMNIKAIVSNKKLWMAAVALLVLAVLAPQVLKLVQKKGEMLSAPSGDDTAVANTAEISAQDETEPPEDERPQNGACGSAKQEADDVPSESVSAFDPTGDFSPLGESNEPKAEGGLIDKLSAVLGQ